MPDRIPARLKAELDAVQLAAPSPAGARYRAPLAARPRRFRGAGYALAGVVGAVLTAGAASLAGGSADPVVWTMEVAAGIHRLQEPEPPAATPAAVPTAGDVARPAATAVPSYPAGAGPGGPGVRLPAAATPEPRDSPERGPSPDTRQGRPAATAEPSEEPREGGGDGGREGTPAPRPSPSPQPTDR